MPASGQLTREELSHAYYRDECNFVWQRQRLSYRFRLGELIFLEIMTAMFFSRDRLQFALFADLTIAVFIIDVFA